MCSPSFFWYDDRDSAVLIPRPIFSRKQRKRAIVKGGDSRGSLRPFTLDNRPRCYNATSGADNMAKGGQVRDAAGSGEAAPGAEPPGWDKTGPGTTNALKARGAGAHNRAASERPTDRGNERKGCPAVTEGREGGASGQTSAEHPERHIKPRTRHQPQNASKWREITNSPTPANYTKCSLVPPCGVSFANSWACD